MTRFVLASLFFTLAALACGPSSRSDIILGLTGDAAAGEATYAADCAACHGADGQSGSANKDIREGGEDLVEEVLSGNDEGMPAFDEQLSDQEIADLLAYVETL